MKKKRMPLWATKDHLMGFSLSTHFSVQHRASIRADNSRYYWRWNGKQWRTAIWWIKHERHLWPTLRLIHLRYLSHLNPWTVFCKFYDSIKNTNLRSTKRSPFTVYHEIICTWTVFSSVFTTYNFMKISQFMKFATLQDEGIISMKSRCGGKKTR